MKGQSIEERELLLKDLCARLPYGVKGKVYAEITKGEYDITGDMIFFDSAFDVILDAINTSTEEIHVIAIGNEDTVDFIEGQQIDGKPYTIDEFKPYLRPMSSMTQKEVETYHKKNQTSRLGALNVPIEHHLYRTQECIDWLIRNHFDFRGLISKGLAITAPKGMYHIRNRGI